MAEAIKRAFVFPGQGSQKVGMASSLIENSIPEIAQAAKETFGQAREILKSDFLNLSAEQLDQTKNTQPAILTTSIAAWRGLSRLNINPAIVAGHSLGEISALVAAGSISFEDGLNLAAKRGKIMEDVGRQNPGSMMAIIGLPIQAINLINKETGAEIANINSPNQTVISGKKDVIEEAGRLAKTQGGRPVKLNVSIASHSSLMEPAKKQVTKALKDVKIYDPLVPFIQGTTGNFAWAADEIKSGLVDQLTSTVQFVKAVELMGREGVDQFIEVGPKNVLTGLITEINKSSGSSSEAISLERFLQGEGQAIMVRGDRPDEKVEFHLQMKFLLRNSRYIFGLVMTSTGNQPYILGLTNLDQEQIMNFLRKKQRENRKQLPPPKV